MSVIAKPLGLDQNTDRSAGGKENTADFCIFLTSPSEYLFFRSDYISEYFLATRIENLKIR
jgi:hypothetical protein